MFKPVKFAKVFAVFVFLGCGVVAQTQIKQYQDPTEPIKYFVLGKLPKARVVSTKDTLMEAGRNLFSTDRLRKLTSDRIEVECVWYEFDRDDNPSLRRTEFIALVDSQSSVFLTTFVNSLRDLSDIPSWLASLDAMCMFNKSNVDGIRKSIIPTVSAKYVPELNGVPIKMVKAQNGWILKVGK